MITLLSFQVVSLDECEDSLTNRLKVAADGLQKKAKPGEDNLPPVPPPRRRKISHGRPATGKLPRERGMFFRSRSLSASKMTLNQLPELEDSANGQRPSSTGTKVKGTYLMEGAPQKEETDLMTPVENALGCAKDAW